MFCGHVYYFSACRSGFYGADCLLACGHCFGPDTCYHVNGSCLGGCQAGFTGDKCNTCKSHYVFYLLLIHVQLKGYHCFDIYYKKC